MSSRSTRSKRRLSSGIASSISDKRSKLDKHEARPRLGLTDLPEEILLLILDCIYGGVFRNALDVYFTTLYSLCLTNKKFNRLTRPYLYRGIHDAYCDPAKAISTFMRDPESADRIVYLIFWAHKEKSHDERGSYDPQRLPLREQHELAKRLGKLGVPEMAHQMRHGFGTTLSKDYLATVLLLARNVVYLEVDDINSGVTTAEGVSQRPTWLEFMSAAAFQDRPSLSQHFQHLSHLRLKMGSMDLEQIAPLFRLPALYILHLEGFSRVQNLLPQLWDVEVAQRCSTIQILLIEATYLSSGVLVQMLGAISQLKVLYLDYEMLCMDERRAPNSMWSTLGSAITMHKDTLECLYALCSDEIAWDCLEGNGSWIGDHTADCDTLGSLHGLQNLRYIDTGLRPFRSNPSTTQLDVANLHDNLPPSLKHLVLQVERNAYEEQEIYEYGVTLTTTYQVQTTLATLAANCKSMLPLLQDVVVWLPRRAKIMSSADFSSIKTTFEKLNIDLAVMAWNPDTLTWGPHHSIVNDRSSIDRCPRGCKIIDVDTKNRRFPDKRTPYKFHGRCSAYHYPDPWSVVDEYRRHKP